jgi:hypothetical protein
MVKTIKVSDETHGELKRMGTLGDSFDTMIKKLMKYWRTGKK